MKYEDILEVLAPCGLDCARCARYAGGGDKGSQRQAAGCPGRI